MYWRRKEDDYSQIHRQKAQKEAAKRASAGSQLAARAAGLQVSKISPENRAVFNLSYVDQVSQVFYRPCQL